MAGYRQDLAYIHDVGYSDYALNSATGILKVLIQHGIEEGLIVDLGCGSGLSAQVFAQAGYQVFGVDLSEDLIAIARNRLPAAQFQVSSLYQANIPPCSVVTSIGECLNYLFDPNADEHSLGLLFERVYAALMPGGLFIFDIAEPGQLAGEGISRHFSEGNNWIVLVEKQEDRQRAILTRRITTLRQIGDLYRRDDEVHRLQLYPAGVLTPKLTQAGFDTVHTQRTYGDQALPPAHAVLIAQKRHQTADKIKPLAP